MSFKLLPVTWQLIYVSTPPLLSPTWPTTCQLLQDKWIMLPLGSLILHSNSEMLLYCAHLKEGKSRHGEYRKFSQVAQSNRVRT